MKYISKCDALASEAPSKGGSIDAKNLSYSELNDLILRVLADGRREVKVRNVRGQRYIGVNIQRKEFLGSKITIHGYPGNCLANFNSGIEFVVFGNAADDVGDTMHAGRIVIHGDARDVIGQAFQGGEIFVRGSVGNRAAIQMREYTDKRPFLVVSGSADDYFGEYMAGGIAVVLGLGHWENGEHQLVGRFVGTGMVGGRIYIRSRVKPDTVGLPPPREDVITYLEALKLEGNLDEATFESIMKRDSLDYHWLKERLPQSFFRQVQRFFVNRYTKPLLAEYRELSSQETKDLEPGLQDYFKSFGLSNEAFEDVISSKFTVIEPESKSPRENVKAEIAED